VRIRVNSKRLGMRAYSRRGWSEEPVSLLVVAIGPHTITRYKDLQSDKEENWQLADSHDIAANIGMRVPASGKRNHASTYFT
jgi:hypothetical protein